MIRRARGSRLVHAVAGLATLGLTAACVSSGTVAFDADLSSEDASALAARELGACNLDADFLSPVSQIERIVSVDRLVEIEDYDEESNTLRLSIEGTDGGLRSATFLREPAATVETVEFAERHFDTVSVATAGTTGRIGFVIGEWADGRALVLPDCANVFVGSLFGRVYGDRGEEKLVTLSGGDLSVRDEIVAELTKSQDSD